ncbi:hypothetical protein [Microbacterium sp.]|uniref:PTS sugar transporter subunit IIB n=1 Tax=Microbacterium sp. TaxID=51671 RepID=UPI002812475F|nr:hypothetical protein [Microbacterium sp.]
MRILVVCGAGASSTFVAQRLRRAAALAGLDWQATAGMPETALDGGHDLLLLGPHLASRLEAIRDSVQSPVAVLPDDVFSDHDGSRTLTFALSILADADQTPKGSP